MHNTSYQQAGEFVARYLDPGAALRILDLGARSSNGSFRPLFVNEPEPFEVRQDLWAAFRERYTPGKHWAYLGADVSDGENVDILMADPYEWEIEPNSFDVVVSGQCLEHVPDVRRWVEQIAPLLKVGGLVFVIAPCGGDIHSCGGGHYWLIMPDGMRWLLEDMAGLEIIDVWDEGKDCIGIARKVAGTPRPSKRYEVKGHGWKGAA